MFKKNKKNNNGFTLVETLIAISILMISVAAPLSLAAKGIEAASLAKQQIIAYYLAQDAYEFVKNVTDTNKLNNETYANGGMIAGNLNDVCVADNCRVDTLTGRIEIYTNGDKVGYKDSVNIYGYDGSGYSDTIYSRYLKVKKVKDTGSSIDEVEVSVTVK